MSSLIAERRLEIVRAFTAKDVELPRLEHTRLRYSLGTSTSELRVPFHVTADVARLFTQSARQLALMLISRHRALIGAEFDRFMLSDEYGSLPAIPATLAPAQGGPEIRAAAELGAFAHPGLTGGVMAAWLGPGGGGRSLVALIIETLRRAFAEKGSREDTPTLAALMLSSLLPSVDAELKSILIPAGVDRFVRAAAGVGVFLAIRLGVERALREAKAGQEAAIRVEAVFSPAVLLGGRAELLGGHSSLYGCDLAAGIPGFEGLLSQLSGPSAGAGITNALLATLDREEEVAHRAEALVAAAGLRQTLIEVVLEGERGGLPPDLTAYFRDLAIVPSQLSSVLADEDLRKRLAKDLSRLDPPASEGARAGLAVLVAAFKGYKPKEPAACLKLSRREARARYAAAASAALADLWLERALSPTRRALELRTGDETEGGLETEYSVGRLYRISAAAGPILHSSITAPMGHLFVDVKDFTRRTSLLGEAAVADFLRREFYLPILSSAKKHFGGMSHLLDKGGVTVNNLLGDALSLSGDITALIELAGDIRSHLDSYERQLARTVTGEAVARAVKAIEADFEKKARQLASSPRAARLPAEKELALSRARGEGLEAGVFISFGLPPTVVQLDDEVFGRSRVAIADRINESARGTARAIGARARADALLALERARRGDRGLSHPWLVFVGAPLTLQVSAADEDLARAALHRAGVAAALEAISGSVREQLEEALKAEDRPGEIYNAGAAVSDEALLAFQEAIGARRSFRTVELSPQQLHHDLLRRYYFPPEPIRLTAAFTEAGTLAELFRFAGKARFKGLEKTGGIGIWELVSGSAAALLARYHGAQWHRGQPTAGA